MATGSRWFPNATNGITLGMQQVFQLVLTFVYANQSNIATLQAQVATLQAAAPTTSFPAHYNSLGTPTQQAYNPATGDQFFCYATNKWVRLGPSGTSTTF